MKNIVENQDIKTDKPLPMSYEAMKAERDALADRVNALAVERDAARNALASIYKTVTGELPEWSNWHAYLDDIVEEVGVAVAAIQAQAVEDAVTQVLSVDTIASTAVISHLLRTYATELREAK
ncbi:MULTISPECIES: hypothetical protein [Serratia]|uniref:hypothetical protein n=1 Tax=Serratia TaxID=613 RepID=UPI00217A0FCE|nr:hypothetical protein [Serratia grimesii]CAI1093835.1 Uncharacterised protein [Serratia grimesii]